jgi:hypothetical protein
MKYLLFMLLAFASVSAHAKWEFVELPDGFYQAITASEDSYLAFLCGKGECRLVIWQSTLSCKKGASIPGIASFVGRSGGAANLTFSCVSGPDKDGDYLGSLTMEGATSDVVAGSLAANKTFAIVLPSTDGDFIVKRFDLEGSEKAISQVLQATAGTKSTEIL